MDAEFKTYMWGRELRALKLAISEGHFPVGQVIMKMHLCVRRISLKPFHKMILFFIFFKEYSFLHYTSNCFVLYKWNKRSPVPSQCWSDALARVSTCHPASSDELRQTDIKRLPRRGAATTKRGNTITPNWVTTSSLKILDTESKKQKTICCAVHCDITLQGWYPGATAARYFYSSFPSIFYSKTEKNYVLIRACDDFHRELSWRHLLPSDSCFQCSHAFTDGQIRVMGTNPPWVTLETRNMADGKLVHVWLSSTGCFKDEGKKIAFQIIRMWLQLNRLLHYYFLAPSPTRAIINIIIYDQYIIIQPTQRSTDVIILSVIMTNTSINRLHYGDILCIWWRVIMHTFTAPYRFRCLDVIDWTLHRLKEKWSWTFCHFVPLGRLKRLIRQCLVHFITLIPSLARFPFIASASLCFHTCSPLNSFASSVRKCAYGYSSLRFLQFLHPLLFLHYYYCYPFFEPIVSTP